MTTEPGSTTPAADERNVLRIIDPASLPKGPDPDTFYHHKARMFPAIREMFKHKEIVFALAERDIRVSYKQATLGIGWAFIGPVIQVVLFTLVFGHLKAFHVPGVPYPIYTFTGIMCWSYFTGSFSSGSNSMVGNLNLLQKTQFPREGFPLSQMLEQVLYTAISLIPLSILFLVEGFAPKPAMVWAPLLIAVELVFTCGITLAMAALIVYVRDLQQIMSLIIQLGLFATPIIWPLVKISNVTWGPFHHFDARPYVCFINPLAAVIDNLRRTMLLGHAPEWGLLGIAAVSACLYFVMGYSIFKRLEVGFADIA